MNPYQFCVFSFNRVFGFAFDQVFTSFFSGSFAGVVFPAWQRTKEGRWLKVENAKVIFINSRSFDRSDSDVAMHRRGVSKKEPHKDEVD